MWFRRAEVRRVVTMKSGAMWLVVLALGSLVLVESFGSAAIGEPPPRILTDFLSLPEVWGYLTEVASLAGIAAPSVSSLAEAIVESLRDQEESWMAANAAIARSLLEENGKSIVEIAARKMLEDAGITDITRIQRLMQSVSFTPLLLESWRRFVFLEWMR